MGKTLKLGNEVGRHLEVHIEGVKKSYRIPLANSLKMGDAMALRRVTKLPKKQRDEGFLDAFYEIVCRYVPQKYIDGLSMEEFSQLVEAWNDASNEDGVGLGE